jgi:hypothetical protein
MPAAQQADPVPNLKAGNGVVTTPYAEFISNTGMGPGAGSYSWMEGTQHQLVYDFFLSTPQDLSNIVYSLLGSAYRIPTANGQVLWQSGVLGGNNNGLQVVSTAFGPWVPGIWVGRNVVVTGGTATGATGVVASNTATSLFLTANWTGPSNPDGSSTFQIQSAGAINRILPMRFPWPGLRHFIATRISNLVFYSFANKQTPGGGIPNFAFWNRARMTVNFSAVNFALYTDQDIVNVYGGNEFFRFVEKKTLPSVYAITRQAGAFKYFEGPGAGITPVNTGVSQQLQQVGYEYTWWNVPEAAIFDSNGDAVNLLGMMGALNLILFDGQTAGTVLMSDPRIEPQSAPFQLNNNIELPQRLWKATIRTKFFDPQPNGAGTRGWNAVPAPPGADCKWYGISSDGTPNGQRLYGKQQDLNLAFSVL